MKLKSDTAGDIKSRKTPTELTGSETTTLADSVDRGPLIPSLTQLAPNPAVDPDRSRP